MESSNQTNTDDKDFMKRILSRYDNTEYAGRNVEDIDIPDDAEDVMCNIYVSELNRKTPHIVFAEIISRPEGNKMRTHVMSLDTLKYYLKDPNAVFTNWVINDDSSEFSQLYYTKLSGEAIRLERTDNPRGAMFEDILGSTYLHMDNLNVGKGGTHGNRRFFQLSLSTGNYLIDSASILPLYHVSKSTVFVLRPRLVDMRGTKIIDTTRSGGIGSHTSTISGTHGQEPSKMIYELIEYHPTRMHKIFNRPGDESLIISVDGRDEDDLKIIEYCFKTYKWGYEKNEYGHDQNSYMEDIVDLENKAQALENTPHDILLNMTKEELNNIHSERDEIIKEIKESRFNLEEFYQGKRTDIDEIEEDSVNRVDDYSYIFSKYNETKEIILDRWYGVIDKETGNAPPGGVDPAIIYSDHIPNHQPIFERNNHKQFVKMVIEDENGNLKSICGKILRIFSNLTAFSRLDDEEDIFYPQKGQWIYHINFLNGKSIIVAESRREIVLDKNGKETEILKQQITLDEPTPYKVTNKNDFTIQLITKLKAMRLCGSVMSTSMLDAENKPEDLLVLNDEIDNKTFDLLLPVGNALETPMGSDALRVGDESPDRLDNSFTEDDTESHIAIMREGYPPHPINQGRNVRVDGEIITRGEAINRSPGNSPARVAQAEQDDFIQRAPRREFPMFPPFLSAPGTGLSDSGRFLSELRRSDDMEEGEIDETDEFHMNSPRSMSSSSGSSSRSLFDNEPRPDPTTRREAATRRLEELGNTEAAIYSLSGTRRRGDFQEVDGRNVSPRVGSPLPIIPPNTMDNLSPLSTPSRTPSESNSPLVVPETPESQMGNPQYYRRQDESHRDR